LNGSRLKPSLRQARKGVCCVRTTAMVLALTLMTLPAAAQSCREWGNQTTCYGGPTVNHYGNSSNPRGGYGAQAPSNPATVSRGNSGATAPAFGSGPIAQPGCSEWGNQTTCYGGPTVNHYGNSSNARGGYVPYQPPSQPPSGGAGGATVSRSTPQAPLDPGQRPSTTAHPYCYQTAGQREGRAIRPSSPTVECASTPAVLCNRVVPRKSTVC
jgi:hypothetical protein